MASCNVDSGLHSQVPCHLQCSASIMLEPHSASGCASRRRVAGSHRFACLLQKLLAAAASDSNDQRPVEPTLPPPLPVVAPALSVALVPLPRSARAEAVLPGSTVGFSPAFVVTGEAWVPVSRAAFDPRSHAAVNTRANAATATAILMMFLRGMR
jgi:hypothetical protein